MEKFCPMTKDECHGEKCAVWVPAKPTRMNYDNGSCHVLREVPAHCGLIRKMPDNPVILRLLFLCYCYTVYFTRYIAILPESSLSDYLLIECCRKRYRFICAAEAIHLRKVNVT